MDHSNGMSSLDVILLRPTLGVSKRVSQVGPAAKYLSWGGQGAHPSLLQVHWVGVHCQHVLAHMGPLISARAATSLLWSVLPKE